MPTLSRFLSIIATFAAVFLAAMLALAYLVPPDTRPMTAPVDPGVLARAVRTDAPPPEPVVAEPEADAGAEGVGVDEAAQP